jgi:hypothetical protein
VKQSVSIKLLLGELTIAMPRSSPAMQLLSAKSLLQRRNLVAVEEPDNPMLWLGAHKQFWGMRNIAYFISDVKSSPHPTAQIRLALNQNPFVQKTSPKPHPIAANGIPQRSDSVPR